MATTKDLTWGGIAVRFLAALPLVQLTFNPTGRWFFLQASQRSLGVVGAFFILALVATVFWALSYWHIFTPGSSTAIAHLTLVTVALILGLGLSWSSVNRRITGQQDTDIVA